MNVVDRGFCLNYVLYTFELMELEWGWSLEGEQGVWIGWKG